MATVTGFTAVRMLAIEAASVVDGEIVGDDLILTKHDATTINAGNVRGPVGSPGISEGTLNTALNDHLPIGTVLDYIGVTAPSSKWLLFGQTVIGAQTLYPDLWAKLPASMKSGANMILPSVAGKVVVAYDSADSAFDSIGETGGAKTHILAQGELPNAVVSINPPSTAVTGTTGDDTIAHTHILGGSTSVASIVPHTHYRNGWRFVMASVADGPHALNINSGTGSNVSLFDDVGADMSYNMSHSHPLPLNTGAATAFHKHSAGTLAVDIPAFNSGALGSGQAHNNLQPYIVFQKIIKVS